MDKIRNWWKEGIVYQIYPKSFKDTNADGIGDLKGIASELDYLASLGVNILWLCPVYESPQHDNGYDISDYRAIYKDFGTLEDWEALKEGAHERGLKLIMDLVVNHTSAQHPWFQEARKSRENPYHGYYIWKESAEGFPTDWNSCFGGPTWTFNEATGEYYLHIFDSGQPDLNWENQEVRREVFDMMNWWLDKGIDGFRMDVISFISKDQSFPSFPGCYAEPEAPYASGPRVHEFLREMNQTALAGRDVMTVGECPGVPADMASLYVGEDRDELKMLFQFDHMALDRGLDRWDRRPFRISEYAAVLEHWHRALFQKGWNSQYLTNHDHPRPVSRFGDDAEYWERSAKMLHLHLLTLPGTPYVFQGDEFGMTNIRFSSITDYRDVDTLNHFKLLREKGMSEEEAYELVWFVSRDNARTPMQWNGSAFGGFSSSEPWIGVNPNYTWLNRDAQEGQADSVLSFFRETAAFRRETPLLVYGDFEVMTAEDSGLFVYRRFDEKESLVVALNFSAEEKALPEGLPQKKLMGNAPHKAGSLGPWEGAVLGGSASMEFVGLL